MAEMAEVAEVKDIMKGIEVTKGIVTGMKKDVREKRRAPLQRISV